MTLIGINLDPIGNSTTAWIFKDVLKQGTFWQTNTGTLLLDGSGYVTALTGSQSYARTRMYGNTAGDHPSGDYTLYYDGAGTVEINGDVVANSGTINIDPSDGIITLEIIDTDPLSSGDYIRNMAFVVSGLENGESFTQNYLSQPFHPLFLETLTPFATLRYMDWLETNDSTQKNPLDIIPSGYRSSHGTGIAPEHIGVLSNISNTNPWICIPHQATDEYVTEFATRLKSAISYEPKIYVEYSNEAWNYQFDVAGYCQDTGLALGLNDSEGDQGSGEARNRYYSQRAVEIFDIFDTVYAGCNEIVKVLGTQFTVDTNTEQIIGWQGAGGIADSVAVATYINLGQNPSGNNWASDTATSGELFAMGETGVLSLMDSYIDDVMSGAMLEQVPLAHSSGLSLIAYEGGPGLVGLSSLRNNDDITTLLTGTNENTGIHTVYTKWLNMWETMSGGEFVAFNHIREHNNNGSWGHLQYQSSDTGTTPKFSALADFGETPPEQSGTPCVNISGITWGVWTSPTTGVAPLLVYFDAISGGTCSANTTVPNDQSDAGHEIDYSWFFDDPASSFIYKPSVNTNIARGHQVCHVFENAGSYTVTGIFTDPSGQTATGTIPVTVNAFAGTNFYLNATGSDLNDGLSSGNAKGSLTGALTLLFSDNGERQLNINRGDTFTESSMSSVEITGLGPYNISTYGVGDNPVWNITGNSSALSLNVADTATISGLRITNQTLLGPGTGIATQSAIGTSDVGDQVQMADFLVLHTEISGFQDGFQNGGEFHVGHGGITDCFLHDLGDYGIHLNYAFHFAVLGTILSGVNAISGVSEHAIRINGSHCLISNCDFYHGRAAKSMVKWYGWDYINEGTGRPTLTNEYNIISDNTFVLQGEDDQLTQMVAIGPHDNTNSNQIIENTIFERNRLNCGGHNYQTLQPVLSWNPENTVRNNVIYITGANDAAITVVTIDTRGDNTGVGQLPIDNRVYNNSIYYDPMGVQDDLRGIRPQSDASGTIIYNNLVGVSDNFVSTLDVIQDAGVDSVIGTNARINDTDEATGCWVGPTTGLLTLISGAQARVAAEPVVGTTITGIIDAGTNIPGLYIDYTLTERGDLVDIGAYEFTLEADEPSGDYNAIANISITNITTVGGANFTAPIFSAESSVTLTNMTANGGANFAVGGADSVAALDPMILGSNVVGNVRTAAYTYSGTNLEGNTTFQWRLDSSPIGGATGQSYTDTTGALPGQILDCQITPVNITGLSGTTVTPSVTLANKFIIGDNTGFIESGTFVQTIGGQEITNLIYQNTYSADVNGVTGVYVGKIKTY